MGETEAKMNAITHRPSYDDETYKALLWELWDKVYKFVYDLFDIKFEKAKKTNMRYNSLSDIRSAIRKAHITYKDGYFIGTFNSAVGSTLRGYGATFDKRKKAYRIDINSLPADIRADIAVGNSATYGKLEMLNKHLDEAEKNAITLSLQKAFGDIFDKLNIQTKKVLARDIEIPYEDNMLKKVYQANLELHINDWKAEAVERLRDQVKENVEQGFRAEKLVGQIRGEFGVTRNKAKFLARQETSLLVSKYAEGRYKEAGVTRYKWSTTADHRARPDHRDLNGRIFSFDDPPIVDKASGKRANPGEDYNCRCSALPILNIS